MVLVNKKALKSKKHEFDIYDNAETINKWCSSNLFEHAKRESFLADLNQTFVSNIFNEETNTSIALIGLGDPYKQSVDHFRQAGAHAYKLANKKQIKSLQILLPKNTEVPLFDAIQAITEVIILDSYSFKKYHS